MSRPTPAMPSCSFCSSCDCRAPPLSSLPRRPPSPRALGMARFCDILSMSSRNLDMAPAMRGVRSEEDTLLALALPPLESLTIELISSRKFPSACATSRARSSSFCLSVCMYRPNSCVWLETAASASVTACSRRSTPSLLSAPRAPCPCTGELQRESALEPDAGLLPLPREELLFLPRTRCVFFWYSGGRHQGQGQGGGGAFASVRRARLVLRSLSSSLPEALPLPSLLLLPLPLPLPLLPPLLSLSLPL